MKAEIRRSQFEALEEPQDTLVVNVHQVLDRVVADIIEEITIGD